MYAAAEEGYLDIVADLIEHGAYINQTTPKNATALLNAAEEGHSEVVEYLLAQGADPAIKTKKGTSPEEGAKRYGHFEIARTISQASAQEGRPSSNQRHYSEPLQQIINEAGISSRFDVEISDFEESIFKTTEEMILRGSLSDVSAKQLLAYQETCRYKKEGFPTIPFFFTGRFGEDENLDTFMVQFMKNYSLAAGIQENNASRVKDALEAGANPNSPASRCLYKGKIITPIVEAAVIGSFDITKMLVDYGADPNFTQKNGESALAVAANNGDIRIVRYLLENQANPNMKSWAGTPLATTSDPEVMRALLEGGADPNIPDKDGDLPLVVAIQHNGHEQVKLLIQHGSDPTHKNKQGRTALDFARAIGNQAIIDLLEGRRSPELAERKASASSSLPELSTACKEGDFYKALSLLKSGANPNDVSPDGKTPLFYCSEVALACLLDHYGADVNATDGSGNTPIVHFILGDNAKENCERAIMALIEAGADVDIKNNEGLSPRDIANEIDDQAIKSAFERGLRIVNDKKAAYGKLLAQQEEKRLEWRREAHPTSNKHSWENKLISCFNACAFSDTEVLKEHEDFVRKEISAEVSSDSMNPRTMLMEACELGSADIVEYLLSLGADVNQVDDTGQAVLRYAAITKRDAERKIDLLIKAGANVNHTCFDGSAALSDAAFHQRTEAAKALIAHGADVNHRDDRGYTALNWACANSAPDINIVELLLRNGAKAEDLYQMNCILTHIDYEYGRGREVMLNVDDIEERLFYEHTLVAMKMTPAGYQQLQDQSFYH